MERREQRSTAGGSCGDASGAAVCPQRSDLAYLIVQLTRTSQLFTLVNWSPCWLQRRGFGLFKHDYPPPHVHTRPCWRRGFRVQITSWLLTALPLLLALRARSIAAVLRVPLAGWVCDGGLMSAPEWVVVRVSLRSCGLAPPDSPPDSTTIPARGVSPACFFLMFL